MALLRLVRPVHAIAVELRLERCPASSRARPGRCVRAAECAPIPSWHPANRTGTARPWWRSRRTGRSSLPCRPKSPPTDKVVRARFSFAHHPCAGFFAEPPSRRMSIATARLKKNPRSPRPRSADMSLRRQPRRRQISTNRGHSTSAHPRRTSVRNGTCDSVHQKPHGACLVRRRFDNRQSRFYGLATNAVVLLDWSAEKLATIAPRCAAQQPGAFFVGRPTHGLARV